MENCEIAVRVLPQDVVDAETDVHNGGAVLEGAHQAALARLAIGLIPSFGLRLVQVPVLVPGGSQQARGRVRGEGGGGDGVVRRLRELELRCCVWGRRD